MQKMGDNCGVELLISNGQLHRPRDVADELRRKVVIEDVRLSYKEAGALVILTLGVTIAVWQGVVGGWPGSILCCVLGTISSGAMMTFLGSS